MGNECGSCFSKKRIPHENQSVNEFIRSNHNFDQIPGESSVHMLITALDYKKTNNSLTCTIDAMNMLKLAKAAGIEDVTVLDDKAAPLTIKKATKAIKDTLAKCKPGDVFVFFYAGHGTQLKDKDTPESSPGGDAGDGGDHFDEAYCFQDDRGQINFRTCMTDDVFADLLTKNMDHEVKAVILSDCCHSDTICDFGKPIWDGFDAISISGCKDEQTSGDTGRGGIFTHSMLLAIEKLSKAHAAGRMDLQDGYSVELLYNATLQEKQKYFKRAAQGIATERTKDHQQGTLCWPLIPKGPFTSPLNSRSRGITIPGATDDIPENVANNLSEEDSGATVDPLTDAELDTLREFLDEESDEDEDE